MKPMIQAHLVERDQFGFWTHPNYPDLADNCSSSEAQETLRRLGLELQNVFMESDAPRLYDSARSDQRYSEWIPTRPEGAGWFVLSIHDTDNGPVCQYVRPLGEHLSPIDLDAAAEQHERLLSEACAKALNQRDVALARVASLESKLAELEKQEPVGVMRASSEMGVAPYADIWPWLEPGQKLYTTPVAQAQHCAVLDAEKLIAQFKDCASHAGDPERAAAFNDAISEVHAMLAGAPSQAKPSADEREQFLMANLLAALEVALGNVAALDIVDRVRQVADRIYPTSNLSPVPQAWLDVQAERLHSVPEWTSSKPAVEGAYWVRGNGLVEPFVVLVKLDQGELWCNLHMRNTDTNFGYGYAVDDLSSEFEWCGPLAAATGKSATEQGFTCCKGGA